MTPFGGSPYLVLLGARPTVLGNNLQNHSSSAKLSGRPPMPTVKIKTFIAYRQLPAPRAKTTKLSNLFSNFENFGKISTFFFWKFWEFRNLKPPQLFCLLEIGNFYIFGKETTVQRNSSIPNVGKGIDYCQQSIDYNYIFIIWNKTKC